MKTVVYPLTVQFDYTELRYSLRSLEKYLTSPFEVVIVGDHVPEWINNVTQIHLPDIQGQNNYSVRRKVISALHYADEILFMNDDFYLLKPVTDFPYYSSGILKGKGEAGARPVLKKLEELNKPTKYYGHYPCVYKKNFIEILKYFANDCITKSAYCNFMEVESIEIPDCKIMTAKKPEVIKEIIRPLPAFSTGVYSIKSCLPVLDELFSEPSNYEI